MFLDVVWLINGDEGYGVRSAIRNLSNGLQESGKTLGYLSLSDGPFVQELAAISACEVEVIPVGKLPVVEGSSGPLGLASLLKWMMESQRAGQRLAGESRLLAQARRLHVMWPNLLLTAIVAASRQNRPSVVWEMVNAVHNSHAARLLYVSLCKASKVNVIANSSYTATTLNRRALTQSWPAVMHLSTSITSVHAPTDARNPVVIVCAARMHPSKMQLELIRAVGRYSGSERIELRLIGDGCPRHVGLVEQEATSVSSMSPHEVLLTGPAAEGEVRQHIEDASLVACLRKDAEPFGLSVIEGMMAGKPVLATALGGPAETMVDGETGWLIREPTEDAILAGLDRAFAARSRWSEVGASGRRRAEERFSPSVQAARYMTLTGV